MYKKLALLVVVVVAVILSGCTEKVPPGTVGRIMTANGWNSDILKPGNQSCFGRDTMYLLDVTNKAFPEKLSILIGGKVNLKVDFTVRVHVNTDDNEQLKKAFESITAGANHEITIDQMYSTFLQMKAQAVPRVIFQAQPDIQTACANARELEMEVRKQMQELAKSTPLVLEDCQITNYDWPESLTKAQEALVQIQLKEAAAEAQVKADLKKAEGDLKIAEADKLVEEKKAEAVAASIRIIKGELAGAPEYLMWHQIRVMGQAALGPNNCFILYPFATDSSQVKQMLGNANLSQMLKPDGPKPEAKKNPAPIEQLKDQ